MVDLLSQMQGEGHVAWHIQTKNIWGKSVSQLFGVVTLPLVVGETWNSDQKLYIKSRIETWYQPSVSLLCHSVSTTHPRA